MENLHTDNLEMIFREDGLIKNIKPDYSPRPSQIEAAHKILDTLYKQGITIVEGPCGFGKTFSYLVPLFEYLHKTSQPVELEDGTEVEGEDKRAVIATNGISLQEQLFHKDLPIVQKLFSNIYPVSKSFAILKGKSNFVCMKKMAEAQAQALSPATKEEDRDKRRTLETQWNQVIAWYSGTASGDLAELDFVPDSSISQEICCAENEECIGKGCPMYEECFYQRHRVKAYNSDIVITNYHVLFWDLEIGNHALLPPYDVIVFDEAHEIADIFRDFKSNKFSIFTLWSIRNTAKKLTNKYKLANFLLSKKREASNEDYYPYLDVYNEIETNATRLLEILYDENFKDNKWAENKMVEGSFAMPPIASVMSHQLEILASHFAEAAKYCAQQIQVGMSSGGHIGDDYYTLFNSFSGLIERCLKITSLLEDCEMSKHLDNVVFWLDKNEDKKGDTEKCKRVSINYCPVDVADHLYNAFFKNGHLSAILTSATLSVNKEFKYIRSLLGLDIAAKEQRFTNAETGAVTVYPPRDIQEFIGISPFNLTEQQLWYLPQDTIAGNSPEFDKAVIPLIMKTVFACRGGALCLFTSVKGMNDAFYALRYQFSQEGIRLMKQGDMPKGRLLEMFREDVDSVLFATRSFFTGVDIPGESLRCLIIDKLPFPSPGDPVMQKLSKQDGAFYKYFVPMMIITLKQAIGRGVRAIDDKCVICVMDNRMATASYKSTINYSFNYIKTGTRNLDDLPKFLEVDKEPEWYDPEDDELPFN